MKPLWLLLVGAVVGWAASDVEWSRDAAAQEDELPTLAPLDPDNGGMSNPGPELKKKLAEWTKEAAEYSQINRYQISADGNSGAFVIDSVSGKVWRVVPNARPQLVADTLPSK